MNLFEVVKANINTQEVAQTYSIGDCSWIGKNGMHHKRRKMCWTSGLWKPATVCHGQSISWTSCCKAIPMNEAKP